MSAQIFRFSQKYVKNKGCGGVDKNVTLVDRLWQLHHKREKYNFFKQMKSYIGAPHPNQSNCGFYLDTSDFLCSEPDWESYKIRLWTKTSR